jgi:hypothetical protein
MPPITASKANRMCCCLGAVTHIQGVVCDALILSSRVRGSEPWGEAAGSNAGLWLAPIAPAKNEHVKMTTAPSMQSNPSVKMSTAPSMQSDPNEHAHCAIDRSDDTLAPCGNHVGHRMRSIADTAPLLAAQNTSQSV